MNATVEALVGYDVEAIRAQFPVLHQKVGKSPLAYLDNAASSQKPQAVIDALVHYYSHDHANVHRGVHMLSQRATAAYEAARVTVQRWMNASAVEEIIFTRGTTEGINLVADTFGEQRIGEGDEILITELEHHANLVPWQQLCKRKGARLVVAPVFDNGALDLERFVGLINPKTRLIAVSHASNSLGTINPVQTIIAEAKRRDIPVLLDGAQWVPHAPIDVQALGADFYVFSAHKVYGPTGVGVLWGRLDLLEEMPPWQMGGDMIDSVGYQATTFAPAPARFEAGTPNIAGAVALGAALQWLGQVGIEAVAAHEHRLLLAATERLSAIKGLHIIGTAPEKVGVVSFVMDGVHPSDIGTLLDQSGVAVRTGHHCTEPLMKRLGVSATARASFACYNTLDEVERLAKGIETIQRIFL